MVYLHLHFLMYWPQILSVLSVDYPPHNIKIYIHTTFNVLSFLPLNFHTYCILVLLITSIIYNKTYEYMLYFMWLYEYIYVCVYIYIIFPLYLVVSLFFLAFLLYKRNIRHLFFLQLLHHFFHAPAHSTLPQPYFYFFVIQTYVISVFLWNPGSTLYYAVGITSAFRDQMGHVYQSTGSGVIAEGSLRTTVN